MVNWLLDNRFIGSIIPPLHLEWRDFALLVLRTQSFLYGWWDCVAMCSRLCKVAEESLFHVCCAENESRRGCELHQSTKAPKHQSTKAPTHWQTVQQCSRTALTRAGECRAGAQLPGILTPLPLPSLQQLLGAVLVRSIFENQKSTSAPPPLGTLSLLQPAPSAPARVVEFFQFFLLSDTGGPWGQNLNRDQENWRGVILGWSQSRISPGPSLQTPRDGLCWSESGNQIEIRNCVGK